MRTGPAIVSASVLLAGVVLLGRLTGFVREMEIAALFGVSAEADFAVILLTTPDLLVNLLLAGGLGAVLVPEFRPLAGPARTALLIRVCVIVAAGFCALATLIAVVPQVLVAPLAPAYSGQPLARLPFAIMAIAIPLSALSGVTTAFLNARDRFLVAGAGTLIFNLTLIVALFLMAGSGSILLALAAAISLGAGFRLLSQLAVSAPLLDRPAAGAAATPTGELAARFAAALGATTLMLLVPVVARSTMSFSGQGGIAAFNYAIKLVELPLGIVISSVTTVAFTRLSDRVASGRDGEAGELLAAGTLLVAAAGIAIAAPAIWFSHAIVHLVYGRGRITPEGLVFIAELAAIGMLTIPLVGVSGMATAMLNARKRPGIVLRRTLLSLLVLPFALAPGLILGDARLTMAALPVFHLVLAVLTAAAAGLRVPWPMLRPAAIRLALAGLFMAAVFAADHFLGPFPPAARVAMALAAMFVALLICGVRASLARLRL